MMSIDPTWKVLNPIMSLPMYVVTWSRAGIGRNIWTIDGEFLGSEILSSPAVIRLEKLVIWGVTIPSGLDHIPKRKRG